MKTYKKCPKCGKFHGLTNKIYCTTCGEYLRGVRLFDGADKELPSEREMCYSQSEWSYAVGKLFNRHKAAVIAALFAVIAVPSVIGGIYNAQGNVYGRVVAALEKGDVARAYAMSQQLRYDYSDSLQLQKYCRARRYETGYRSSSARWEMSLDMAYDEYTKLGAYRDSAERRLVCGYEYAVYVQNKRADREEDLEKARDILYAINSYKDSAVIVEKIRSLLMGKSMINARRDVEHARNASDADESARYYKSAISQLNKVDDTVVGRQELYAQAQGGSADASKRADEAKFDSLKQNLVGKWLDADGNLAYTIVEDLSVVTQSGLFGSCYVQNGELVMSYGMTVKPNELPTWVVSMPSSDRLILTYGEKREELTRKPSAPQSGGLSAKDIEKNIVGTWVRLTPQGEEKLRFMKDGVYDATSVMSIVTTGTYYFDGGALYIRTQTMLGTVESECTPFMDSKDSLWLTPKGRDSENYTRKK